MYWPASSAMVADLTTEDERRVVFATFYTAMNIGVVAGPVLGSIFFVHYRFELLLACTIVEFVYGVLLFFLIRETLPSLIGKAEAALTKRFSLKEQFRSYAVIFTDKPFAIYILAGILVAIAFMQLDLYMALYVKSTCPVSRWSGGEIGPFLSGDIRIWLADGIERSFGRAVYPACHPLVSALERSEQPDPLLRPVRLRLVFDGIYGQYLAVVRLYVRTDSGRIDPHAGRAELYQQICA